MTDEGTMADIIEEKIRDLLLGDDDLLELVVVYRGDPYIVPSKLHPFGAIATLSEGPATDSGWPNQTGPVTHWAYEGAIQIEVLQRDSATLAPTEDRRADVGSYRQTRRLVNAARLVVLAWAGKDGGIPVENRVETPDGTETTLVLQIGRIDYGLAMQSRSDNVTNAGSIPFKVITSRKDYAA